MVRTKMGAFLTLVAIIIGAMLVCPGIAQTVANGSFETGSPGYGPPPSWTSSYYFYAGIAVQSGDAWYNNGLNPDGAQVGFIESSSSASISQAISGFNANTVYQLSYYENSRVFSAVPTLTVSIGSAVVDPAHDVPNVDSFNDYTVPFVKRTVNFTVPAAGTYTLLFNSSTASGIDSTLLLDDVSIVAVPEPGSLVALFSGLVGLVGFRVSRRK